MKVSDILRIKGGTLYTATPDELLTKALALMGDRDIGSLVVMESGSLVGMLTGRELTKVLVSTGGNITATNVRAAMDLSLIHIFNGFAAAQGLQVLHHQSPVKRLGVSLSPMQGETSMQ